MTRNNSRPIIKGEPLAPWLAASLLVMAAYTVGVLVGAAGSDKIRVVLTVALCSVVISSQLVIFRSRRDVEDARRAQRARPAAEELDPWASGQTLVRLDTETNLPPSAAGMLRYSGAVVELLEHAVAVALSDGSEPADLIAGRDDAAALHHLLSSMAKEPVHLQKAAKIYTICSIWQAEQPHLEEAASALDPEFHRKWRARNIAALRLRNGERPRRTDMTLPYEVVTTPA